jgi:uncharacterized phage protein (TIGR01671 family)
MNREIKFRAWDGKLMHTVSELSWMQGGLKFYGPGVGEGVIEANPKFDWEVDTILMQHAGLNDKSGCEIYEGDVIKYPYNEQNGEWVLGEVRWASGSFEIHDDINVITEFLGDVAHISEIIGNVYENPELLKEKNDTNH